MEMLFKNGLTEKAPLLKEEEECWYLPIFGMYHPKNPEKIGVVFDSSAKHNGIFLNDVLMSGLDLNNTLISPQLFPDGASHHHGRYQTDVPLLPGEKGTQKLPEISLVSRQ